MKTANLCIGKIHKLDPSLSSMIPDGTIFVPAARFPKSILVKLCGYVPDGKVLVAIPPNAPRRDELIQIAVDAFEKEMNTMRTKTSKLTCVFESDRKQEAKEQYDFYNTTKKNTRLTKKGKLYRVWVAKN